MRLICYVMTTALMLSATGCNDWFNDQPLVSNDAPRSSDFEPGEKQEPIKLFDEPKSVEPEVEKDPFKDLSIGVGTSPAIISKVDLHNTEKENESAPTPKSNDTQSGDTKSGDSQSGADDATSIQDSDQLAKCFEGSDTQRQRLTDIQDRLALALDVDDWMNSDPLLVSDLRGKIVVLDFWATWCGPCLRSVPHNNSLAEKYADDVVFIGICAKRGSEKMQATVEKRGIEYPVAIDVSGRTVKRWKANGFPDYFIIDREGIVRVADCRNSQVETAIKALLSQNEASQDESLQTSQTVLQR